MSHPLPKVNGLVTLVGSFCPVTVLPPEFFSVCPPSKGDLRDAGILCSPVSHPLWEVSLLSFYWEVKSLTLSCSSGSSSCFCEPFSSCSSILKKSWKFFSDSKHLVCLSLSFSNSWQGLWAVLLSRFWVLFHLATVPLSSLSENTLFFTVSGRPKNSPLQGAGFFDETLVCFFFLQQESLFHPRFHESVSVDQSAAGCYCSWCRDWTYCRNFEPKADLKVLLRCLMT